ncbi:MAG: energy-coupling factor transporter ATPase [Bacilli bacterium]
MSLIEVKNLKFRYTHDDNAINDVSLNIEKGEFVCILGHNGSGKSTLAKLLVGLLFSKRGSITIDGIELTEANIDKIRQKVGIVFQNPDNQFVGITVKDDIAFGLENRRINKQEMERLIALYSTKVGMYDFLDRNPEDLSGGEKQKVAIAGVLAMDPEIIIFDEATSMLDPKAVSSVLDVINNLKNKKTVLSITHNLKEAIYADRVIVMTGGKIVLNGKPMEIFKHYDILKDSNLDILDSMKILDKVKNSNINEKEMIEEALWELSYQK